MQTVRAEVTTAIQADSQHVTPYVMATLADSHNLDDLIILGSSQSIDDQILYLDPLVYWRFEEYETMGAGSAFADLSGNRYIGTVTDSSTLSALAPQQYEAGNCMIFDGVNDAVIYDTSYPVDLGSPVGSVETITGLTNFSISVWVRPDVAGATSTICAKWFAESSNNREWRLGMTGGNWYFQFYDITNTLYTATSSGSTVYEAVWQHLLVVRNGTSLKLYKNGEEIATATVSANAVYNAYGAQAGDPGILAVGRNGALGTGYFAGLIDEFALFDYAVPASLGYTQYYSAINNDPPIDNNHGEYFGPEQIINTISEETYPYLIADGYDNFGNPAVANGEWYTLPNEVEEYGNYGWLSRSKTDSLGDIVNPEPIFLHFAQRKISHIMVSTGYLNERIQGLTLHYLSTAGVWTPVSGSAVAGYHFIPYGESTLEITLDATVDAIGLRVESLGTEFGEVYSRIYEVEPLYKVDLSEYVETLNIAQVREEFETTLPIGITGANSMDITLDNSEKLFNKDGASAYADYIDIDNRFEVGFIYQINLGYIDYDDGTYDYETALVEYDGAAENGTLSPADPIMKGTYWADIWANESSAMSSSVQCRDSTKFFMDDEINIGYFAEKISAGRAIKELALLAGHPARKTLYYDNFYDVVTADRPICYFRWAKEAGGVVTDEYAGFTATLADDCDSGYLSLIPSDTTVDSFVRRDEVLADYYRSIDKSVGYSLFFDNQAPGLCTIADNVDFDNIDSSGTIEMVIQCWELPAATFYYHLATKGTAAQYAADQLPFSVILDENGFITFTISDALGTTTASVTSTTPIAAGTTTAHIYHIVCTFDTTAGTIDVYVNNNVDSAEHALLDIYSNNTPVYVGGTETTSGYYGYFGPLAIYDRPLSAAEVERHYISSLVGRIHHFPYLYAQDETIWDAMITFATADVGMFTMDEDDVLLYEYRNALQDGYVGRYGTVQYTLDEDQDIISGSTQIELQINKVKIPVNNIVSISMKDSSLWRPEEGTSLVIAETSASLASDSTQVSITGLDDEGSTWFSSGYLKLDDEIMSYSSRDGTTLYGLQRGLYGTTPASHASGILAREVRVFNMDYDNAPALVIKRPYISAEAPEFNELTASIDSWQTSAFGGEVVVSATENNVAGGIVILEGTRPDTGVYNFFAIGGVVLIETTSDEEVTDTIGSLAVRPRKSRAKILEIDNPFIQDADYARRIVDYLLEYYSDPVEVVQLEAMGVPHLQLSDRIKIQGFDQHDFVNKEYWLVSSELAYDGGLNHNMTLKEAS